MSRRDVRWSLHRPYGNEQKVTAGGLGADNGEEEKSDTGLGEGRDNAEFVGEGARLAGQLSDPNRLATEVLASWHNHHITAALLRRTQTSLRHDPFYSIEPVANLNLSPNLAELLQSQEDAPVQHRQVRMTVPRGVVGTAYASVLLDEIAEQERHVLTHTDDMLGRSLQARGVRRISLSLRWSKPATIDVVEEVVNVQAILCRGARRLAYVQETFYPRPIPLNGDG
jgi:hypothetical protein